MKIIIYTVMLLFLVINTLSATNTTLIHFDNMSSASASTYFVGNNWAIKNTTETHSNWTVLYYDGSSVGSIQYLSPFDVSSYDYCNISAWLKVNSSYDNQDYICLEYSLDNNVTWAMSAKCINGTSGYSWTEVIQNISKPTSGFKYRFRASSDATNEDAQADDVNITCTSTLAQCNMSINYTTWSNWTNATDSCGQRNRTSVDLNWLTCCSVESNTSLCWQQDNATYQGNYTHTENSTCQSSPTSTVDTSIDVLPVVGVWMVLIAGIYLLLWKRGYQFAAGLLFITASFGKILIILC